MIASGERMDFSSLSRPTADKHSTGGVGDKITLPLAPAGRGVRGRRTPAVAAAGSATPAARSTSSSRSPGWRADLSNDEMLAQLEDVGAVDLRGRRPAGAGRQEALRAARRHRHRRGDPADRVVDHEQEDRRGHRRAGARREGRHRRLHEGRRRGPRAGRDDGRARHRRRRPHGRAAHRHVHPARPDRGQRPRGRGVGRGARGRRAGRRRRADPRAGPRDARRRRA